MRIVAVADTHLFHDELRVPEGDVFIHAGDLCRGGSLSELEGAAHWLSCLPHSNKLVIAGNHDWAFANDRAAAVKRLDPTITYLQDSEVVIGGVRFWGSPWQPAFNEWAFNLPRGRALRDKWALIPTGIDVLITHGPPAGIGDGGGEGYGGAQRRGCEDLRARVVEVSPLLHVFGHIHDAGGVSTHGPTVFANVTTWECERAPTVLELDVKRRCVTPVDVPPARR